MKTRNKRWKLFESISHLQKNFSRRNHCTGQALVEFTLVFLIFLVVAWIPADFGLAFYTGQMALNASREGARVAAASDPVDTAEIVTETCKRLSSALLTDPGGVGTSCPANSNARVSVGTTGGTCNQTITVTVRGNYNFFFYRILRLLVGNAVVPNNFVTIVQSTAMRWEHQASCG
jgi:Flp pilus assembly protein TadG